MLKGRPLSPLSVAAQDRKQLICWSRRRTTAQALAMRARIVLLAADGWSNTAVAKQLSTTQHTVGKWRQRFLANGVDGLLDEQRPGTSRKLSDEDVERVLTLTLESRPAGQTHRRHRSSEFRKFLDVIEKKLTPIPTELKLYCARHTFGTDMLAEGLNLVEVSKLMGHDYVKTTMKYLHPDTSNAAVMVNNRNRPKSLHLLKVAS